MYTRELIAILNSYPSDSEITIITDNGTDRPIIAIETRVTRKLFNDQPDVPKLVLK